MKNHEMCIDFPLKTLFNTNQSGFFFRYFLKKLVLYTTSYKLSFDAWSVRFIEIVPFSSFNTQ